MDSSLPVIWETAAFSPFRPAIGKDAQFFVGFSLVILGVFVAAVFALNRSFSNVVGLGIPASAALAFGVVYMFCAVGVYV